MMKKSSFTVNRVVPDASDDGFFDGACLESGALRVELPGLLLMSTALLIKNPMIPLNADVRNRVERRKLKELIFWNLDRADKLSLSYEIAECNSKRDKLRF